MSTNPSIRLGGEQERERVGGDPRSTLLHSRERALYAPFIGRLSTTDSLLVVGTQVYRTRMRKGGSGSIAGPDRHLLQEPCSRWHPTIHHPPVPSKIVGRGRWWTQGEYDAEAAGQIHRGVVKMEGFLVPRFQRCASIDRHGSTARGVIVGPRAGSRESSRPRRAHDQHHCDEWDTSG